MNAISLYSKKTKAELLAMQAAIQDDPANRNTHGIYIYKPAARKKLDAIAVAITMHLDDERTAAGRTVNRAGYTGRQTKRRR